jgi:hypothetical protein
LERAQGCLQKNLKTFVYLGRGVARDRGGALQLDRQEDARAAGRRKGQPPQPTLQDNTDNNVQDLKNQLKAEREKEQQQAMAAAARADPALASATPAQQAAAAAYGPTGVASPCIPGQPCPQPAGNGQAMATNASRNSPGTAAGAAHCRERSASGPTTPASLPILSTPALPSNSHSKRKDRSDDACPV